MQAYAEWWAGSPDDLGRPEVSPALGDLAGLPPALMFFGTRDSLWPGGQLLVRRAEEAGWPLTYVEEPGLIHVFPILPFLPEASRAWRQTLEFLTVKISAVPFAALDPLTAYSLWKLRQDVFVVEQEAAYADLDGLDLAPRDPARRDGGRRRRGARLRAGARRRGRVADRCDRARCNFQARFQRSLRDITFEPASPQTNFSRIHTKTAQP